MLTPQERDRLFQTALVQAKLVRAAEAEAQVQTSLKLERDRVRRAKEEMEEMQAEVRRYKTMRR